MQHILTNSGHIAKISEICNILSLLKSWIELSWLSIRTIIELSSIVMDISTDTEIGDVAVDMAVAKFRSRKFRIRSFRPCSFYYTSTSTSVYKKTRAIFWYDYTWFCVAYDFSHFIQNVARPFYSAIGKTIAVAILWFIRSAQHFWYKLR